MALAPRLMLVLAAMLVGCATGNGVADGDEPDAALPDDDVPLDDDAQTDFVDATSFPFLDRPSVDAARDVVVTTDAPSVDAGRADVGSADVGFPDVGFPDAGFPDVGFPDVGFPDTGVDVVDVPVDRGVVCAAPAQLCAGVCVDTSVSVTDCGACGRACAAGQSCAAGVCTSPADTGPREGRPCATGADCAGVDCRTDWPGGYCISPCLASGGVCGAGAVCIDDGIIVFCARACTATTQCRSGYGCYRISATGGACAPL